MNLEELKSFFSNSNQVYSTKDALEVLGTKIKWKGHAGASRSLCASYVTDLMPSSHIFVLEDKETAAYFFNDLSSLNNLNKHVFFYPASYLVPYEEEKTNNANVVSRAETLEKIKKGNNSLIVTYPKALFEKVPSKKTLVKSFVKLSVSKDYSIDLINEKLLENNFERVDFVYEPGQFSIRGGILDVFSFSSDNPYRIEFFGDNIESIRTFDASTQLSIKNHKHLNIIPNIQNKFIYKEFVSLFDFIGDKITLWFSSIELTKSKINEEFKKAVKIYNSKNSEILPENLYLNNTFLEEKLNCSSIVEFGTDHYYNNSTVIDFKFIPQPSFNKNFNLLAEDIIKKKKLGYKTIIFSNQPKQIERLYQIFSDINKDVDFQTLNIALSEGFISSEEKVACYTDHQIFERYHRFRLKESFRKAKQALTIKDLYNLKSGDYVTHIDHGIGKFSGLETIDVNGKPQEAIRLLYRDNDVLYVGIHSLHRISKFTSKDGGSPKVNKLGTQTWKNLKQKTKSKIKSLAFDLIKLYAKRKAQPGFSYSEDTYLQNELEASFIYEDTPDQLRATIAVKEDMESKTPMDRLICGDVGFGKTEIAIRAAFKAVADNKQVAILVPTTILSLQHYRSFKERLKDFPCNIDYINRFKSGKQVRKTIEGLEEQKIDILIGTHAIVSNRVKFKSLGLIIIDEEQKFGVSVKDKLKTLRATVDTLTLTATPIPRTLQFSLMGARDLSIINTPPPNRQPVLTEIINFNEEKIRDSISYEVSRGGQVFFVHNRIQNISEVSAMIKRLCPQIRVAVGHGKMNGEELEKIMIGFINHEFDVLLATTIIESGIDIPNANTIIINHANNFGISDLHQLRGRVGRSNKKAFCYLISPPQSTMTSEARKRLEALVQFSDLGSGFNIAMKDLDIRGAGNMLGAEQSGFIADIGFEMYQKILNEAINELQEEEFKELFEKRKNDQIISFVNDCIIETDLEVRIPEDYVNSVSERLSLYREMDNIKNKTELNQFIKELIDRFGPIPQPVEDLILSFKLRWLAQELGIEKLVLKSNKMIGFFISNKNSNFYESTIFKKILRFLANASEETVLKEKNNRLRIVFSDIRTLNGAYNRLEEIFELNEI